MNENASIQRLTASDILRARELLERFQKDDGEAPIVESSDSYLETLLSREGLHMVIAMVNQKVVGGLTAYEMDMWKSPVRKMFFYEIGVCEKYKNQGIGSALIEELKKICSERGIKEMYVLTNSENTAANRLYNKTGGKLDQSCVYYDYNINR